MRTPLLAIPFALATAALALAPGDPAPAFQVRDLRGRTWTQAEKGWVLVDLWASWCAPCLKEIPALNALQQKHAKPGKFTVLGLSQDKGPAPMEKAVKKYAISYPVALAGGQVAEAYGVKGYPMAVLLKDGKVVKVFTGERKKGDLEAALKPYLEAP